MGLTIVILDVTTIIHNIGNTMTTSVDTIHRLRRSS